jgi:hypothetical protein
LAVGDLMNEKEKQWQEIADSVKSNPLADLGVGIMLITWFVTGVAFWTLVLIVILKLIF